ncbi:quinolinate synthase NadA [Liquorilactobacillus satsumensis]|uniref:Quinolinate synthase n=1 Tax=Liquorilactobacillus satsumensis DSM 16230 = JCM 12392 TaxID=1423801 RepID=A0A0R1V711_9LACO|nr:quinolinate synthase NadA [Liquorilactobacillus satsumensis]KRL98882.1 quinolinate synthetase [Liquorilactobacillus satsumensis DSM 16230 = JCM 12392]
MNFTKLAEKKKLEHYYTEDPQQQIERIYKIKKHFGKDLFLVAHHYQKDEIVQFADATGDSLKLAQIAATNKEAKKIVFCGVHFMAETADILTEDKQQVILPDPSAGCSLADMANSFQVTKAWNYLEKKYGPDIMPLTYVNSSAAIKSFVGQKNGIVVTSGNAPQIVAWALRHSKHLFFLPDQHLGRNTALQLGVSPGELGVWNPLTETLIAQKPAAVKVILWDGYCSVHQQFTPGQIANLRAHYSDIKIIVHPECSHAVVAAADEVGSTAAIIRYLTQAPAGARIAVGTDNNLVRRLQRRFTDKKIMLLNPIACSCVLMNRIDLPHLAFTLDNLLQDPAALNIIKVDDQTAFWAKKALDKMLTLS